MTLQAIGDIGTVYGFVDSAISLFGGITDAIFPEADPDSINKFKVFAGMTRRNDSERDTRSTGGHAPGLALWDVSGGFIDSVIPADALTGDAKIAEGGNRIYDLVGRQEPDYLSVVQGGQDGICIHLIIGQSAVVGRQFMWTGDMGRVCGAPWYHQSSPIIDDRNRWTPSCVWIDSNGDSGHIWKGFTLHLGSFPGALTESEDVTATKNLTADAWNNNRDLLCASEPRFSMYEDIQIGHSIRMYKQIPDAVAKPDSEDYAKLALNEDNWDWSDRVPTAALPTNDGGKVPKRVCLDGDPVCPPTGPSWNQHLPEQQETRRRTRREREDNAIVSIKKRQILHADPLIVSNIASHSAIELCNSPYSLGPDMAATAEGMFCDMSEKQLWPICTDASGTYCFDMESQVVRSAESSLPASVTAISTYPSGRNISSLGSAAVVASGSGSGNSAVSSKFYATVDTWGRYMHLVQGFGECGNFHIV